MIAPDLVAAAADAVVRNQLATPALIERELGVGAGVASQLMTALEEWSVVGPPNGHRSRRILVPVELVAFVADQIRRGAA